MQFFVKILCTTLLHLFVQCFITVVFHFSKEEMSSTCTSCRGSLIGQRYVLRDEKETCLKCYETKFANKCHGCKRPIGTESKVGIRMIQQYCGSIRDLVLCRDVIMVSDCAIRIRKDVYLPSQFVLLTPRSCEMHQH